jgi:hypothetical protein
MRRLVDSRALHVTACGRVAREERRSAATRDRGRDAREGTTSRDAHRGTVRAGGAHLPFELLARRAVAGRPARGAGPLADMRARERVLRTRRRRRADSVTLSRRTDTSARGRREAHLRAARARLDASGSRAASHRRCRGVRHAVGQGRMRALSRRDVGEATVAARGRDPLRRPSRAPSARSTSLTRRRPRSRCTTSGDVAEHAKWCVREVPRPVRPRAQGPQVTARPPGQARGSVSVKVLPTPGVL